MSAALERANEHLLKLLEASAKHEKWLESIDHRLAVLNGSVARHEAKLVEAQTFMVSHPRTCEVGEKVDQLAGQIETNRRERQADIAAVRSDLLRERSTEAAVVKERDKWYRRLAPVIATAILIVLTVLVTLVLTHAPTIEKLIEK